MFDVVYFLRSSKGIKIGYTANFRTRFNTLKSEYKDLEILGLIKGTKETEGSLHNRFIEHQIEQVNSALYCEWFKPHTEILEYVLANRMPDDEAKPYINGENMRSRRVVFELPDDLDEQLRLEHKRTGVPIATIIRKALCLYLEIDDTEATLKWNGGRAKR